MIRRSLVLSLIVMSSAALTVAMLTNGHDWGDDFAGHIIQASGLLHGTAREAVAHIASIMEGSSRSYAPVAYPWGFPALLALFYQGCGGLNIFCLKLINIPLFALFLLAFFLLLIRRLPLVDSALVLSVLAFSPVLLPFHNNVLPDLAFLAFSTLSLLLIENIIVRPGRPEGSPLANVYLGFVLFATYALRINGILLIPALFFTQAIVYARRHVRGTAWKRLLPAAAIPYVVFGLLALALKMLLPGGEASYFSHFRPLTVEGLSLNLSTYFALPIEFFYAIPHPDILYGALLPFVIAGIVLHLAEDVHALIYVGLTLLLLIVWPEQQGLRYMFPILPFGVYYSYRGMRATASAFSDSYRRSGEHLTRVCWMAILLMFVVASFGVARANLVRGGAPEDGPFDAPSGELFAWISTHTAPESVVIFAKPRVMRLMTERDALLIDTCDQLSRGTYVVIRRTGDLANQVQPGEVATCNPLLERTPAFENQTFAVYRMLPRP